MQARTLERWCWRAMVVGLVVLAGCGDATPKLSRLASSDVIVAFGDSLTHGTGAAEHESYPAVLGQLLGREVVRAGVPGEVTAQGLQRLAEVIETHRPRLMIVCLGGNDMLRKASFGEIKSNLRAIIREIRGRGIEVVLIGVPQPALLARAPEFYAELAREFAIPYEGEVLSSVLFTADLKSDPIHPNARGYRRVAEAMAALLRKAGAI